MGHRPATSTLDLSRIGPLGRSDLDGLAARTANNESYRFGDRYNYIRAGVFAIGSARATNHKHTFEHFQPTGQLWSVDGRQIWRTHSSGLLVTLVSDWSDGSGNKLDAPWGHAWKGNPTDKPSHLATHPGNVQSRNVLLATSAPTGSLLMVSLSWMDSVHSRAM